MKSKIISYKKNILKEMLFAEALSCAEISDRTGKSIVLTTRILNEMIEDGWIIAKGRAPSSGGRRPLTYALKQTAFYLVAVAMDQFVTRIAIIDAHLNFVNGIIEKELKLANNDSSLEQLADTILDVMKKSGIDEHKFIGIGIGMPGFIDPKKGANYTFLGENTSAYIQAKTNLPVFIENDSSTIALAESKFGQAKGEANTMVVNLSWGVGLGMIINGKLFRGENGFAGELSHIPLFVNGKLCSCGKTGCLETETSLNFMLSEAEDYIRKGRATILKELLAKANDHEDRYEAFIKAANIGDSLTIEIISRVSYHIGRGIAILIHILNPAKIIISGRCSAAGKVWLAPIHQALNEFCIPKLVSNIKVELSKLSHSAEIIGAAALVVENMQCCNLEKTKTKAYQAN